MTIKWKSRKGIDPQALLVRLNQIISIGDGGTVSFKDFDYFDINAALISCIEVPEKIRDDIDVEVLLSGAIRSVALLGALSKDKVIKSINELLREQLSVRPVDYDLLTSLSINGAMPFKTITVGEAQVRILRKSFPRNYSSRAKIVKESGAGYAVENSGYMPVIVRVKSRSIQGGAAKAFAALDFIRGVIVVFSNSGMEISFGNSYKPINKVRLGRIHTLHKRSGEAATDMFWHDPAFVETKIFTHDKPESFSSDFKSLVSAIRRCPYYPALMEGVVRYVRALDEADPDVVVVKLWGAIEAIAIQEDAKYDQVVRRCAFLFDEVEYHRQMLEHLREVRNASAHAGAQSTKAKVACFQMQRYFRTLLVFHGRHAGKFKTLSEANQFLDLPVDKDQLVEKKRLIDEALRFRKYKASRKYKES
jgi:hypothetical protein